ncbi:hypothetical protein EXIGLDRAFT_761049 [Exidia glandulosa HHB12029]|uniref:Uncharacterized protein n=1 Tax=Exidia glandulosa HHB12029 TaxID=1314781 RepID=A0A165NPF4_EXIGL|nr:hypothetical protein EXIGLDRAFT_761049 [Exidia glandulosa HHB12029]
MAETTYEVRYDDTDPVISYSPYGDGSPTGGWETVFAGGTRPAVGGSTYGVGDSTHVTQLPGATLSFMFWGTSITLLGDAGGASYSITVDNDSLPTPTPKGSTLASLTGLPPGEHVLVLQVTSVKSRFMFDQAIFNVGTGSAGTSISNQTHQSLDGSWTYDSGAWHPTEPLTPLPHDNMVVLRTRNPGSRAQVNVSGNAVFLYGNAFPDSSTYEVHLDAQFWQFNASAHNFIQDALIFFYAEMDRGI